MSDNSEGSQESEEERAHGEMLESEGKWTG
jgi:hypothetical protein